jgi:predicted acylesterase/phospholipase RssA
LRLMGGGLRGIISASVLKRVEKSIQYQTQDKSRLIGQSFDMIAGTSNGGILATYFAVPSLNGTADGALGFYDKYAKKIFGGEEKTEPWKGFEWARPVIHSTKRLLHVGRRSPGWFGIARRCFEGLPRHSGSGLDEALNETLPSMTFSDHMPGSSGGRNASLFLVSYDVKYRRPVAFVADRDAKKTFFLRQEALSVPFSPPYQPKSASARIFPGDENRYMSVVRR